MPCNAKRETRHCLQGSCRRAVYRKQRAERLHRYLGAAAQRYTQGCCGRRRRPVYIRCVGIGYTDIERQVPEDVYRQDRPSRRMDNVGNSRTRDPTGYCSQRVCQQARHYRRLCRGRDHTRYGQDHDEVDCGSTCNLRIHISGCRFGCQADQLLRLSQCGCKRVQHYTGPPAEGVVGAVSYNISARRERQPWRPAASDCRIKDQCVQPDRARRYRGRQPSCRGNIRRNEQGLHSCLVRHDRQPRCRGYALLCQGRVA